MTVRLIRRNPLYAATVVVLLGLGIGASTLIFTAVEAFLLRPLPVAKPERLARLGLEASSTHVTFDHSSVYAAVLAQRGRSFESVFTFYPLDAAFAYGRRVETLTCEVVSGNYFASLGLRPQRGAFLDTSSGDALIAVVSHTLWRTVFGGREDVIGAGVRIRGAAFTVVGVAPKGFGGLNLENRTDVWVPPSVWKVWPGNQDIRHAPAGIVVRMRDGVPLAQAEAEVRVLYPAMVDADVVDEKQLTASDVKREKERRVVLASVEHGVSALRKQLATATPALLTAVLCLLLLVAANVSGLMLARGEARRADTALRLSLGASRWSLARAALSESLTLAGAGALLGALIGFYCGPLLTWFLPSRQPLNVELHPDLRVLAFTIAATAGVALLASIAPALSSVRTDLMQVLGQGGTRISAPVSGRTIVTVQVALATLLVAGSVLLERSLDALRSQDPGFRRDRLIVAVLDPQVAGVRPEAAPAVYAEIQRRTRELPGVQEASLSGAPLMRGVGFKSTFRPAGSRVTPEDRLNVSLNYVSETHFRNLGMTIIAGRNLALSDRGVQPTPVVVSESLAKQFFPMLDPLGREFGRAGPDGFARPQYRIAGVVRDAKYRGMREMAPPTFFTLFQGDEGFVTLHVRTHTGEAEMMRNLRSLLATVGPGLAPISMATMEQEIETSLWQERLLSFLSGVFAILAVVIAALGLFGLLAFALARRTREVGIRVAVGAAPSRIAGLFSAYAAAAAGPGILLGMAVFTVARRGLDPLAFGYGASAAWPLAASGLAVLLAAAAAVAVPLFRAARVEPAVALRQE